MCCVVDIQAPKMASFSTPLFFFPFYFLSIEFALFRLVHNERGRKRKPFWSRILGCVSLGGQAGGRGAATVEGVKMAASVCERRR